MVDTNEQKGNYYIIADHLRTTIFAVADGAVFEPKGRGYILKKIDLIIKELNQEIVRETKFIQKANQELAKNYSPQISAETIFFWYDTKGIPLELIYVYLKSKK